MGYTGFARKQAHALGLDDPVRMFVTRDDQALEAAAANANTLEAQYLHLQRTARLGEWEKWLRLMRTRFAKTLAPSTVLWATGLEVERFEAHVPTAHIMIDVVARTLAEQGFRRPALIAALTGRSLADMVTEFERIAEDCAGLARGKLLDRRVVSAHFRSLVYSSLDLMGRHYMESLSSVKATNWFSASAKTTLKQGPAAEFHRWYSHLASAKAGRGDPVVLGQDLQSLQVFGGPLALRTFATLREYRPYGDPNLRGAVQALVRRLDSRPQHRVELAVIAQRDLSALNLAERLGRSAAAAQGASNPYLLAWNARFLGDYDSLRAVMTMPNRDPWQRRGVLELACSVDELPDSLIRAAFEREMAEPATPWAIVDRYSDWLEAKQRYREARLVLERWRARSRSDSGSGFERIFARTQVARLLQIEGRPQAALDTLGDLHRNLQFGAMHRTALILQDLGHSHQALALGWAAHRRYPDLVGGRVLVAELCWRQGRHAQAATILRDSKHPISATDWARTIAVRFIDCFRTRPGDGVKAVEALMRAGFRDNATIGTIPAKLSADGLHQLAFDIQSRVRGDGLQQLEFTALAYGYLKRARGEREAIGWVRRQVSGAARETFCMFAHQERHHELLWEVAPGTLPEGANGDYCWLMRAAACRTVGVSHPRYAETMRYLASAQGTYYLDIARYLMGLRDEAEVLALARGPKRKAETYYFVGFRAEHEGRFRDPPTGT